MSTTHPENDPRKPLIDAVKRKRENDAWTAYMVAVTDIDTDMILTEKVTPLDHDKIKADAQVERKRRIVALAEDSSKALYPLTANHNTIDTLLNEMGY